MGRENMTMIEKVARAICQAQDRTRQMPSWKYYENEARAAIAAMREPTTGRYDSMEARGAFHCIQGAGAVEAAEKSQARAVWQAMIDAALAEGA